MARDEIGFPIRFNEPVGPASTSGSVAPCASAGLSVLIADDDADSRAVYGQLFRHVGFEVLEASDARTALDLAHRLNPDVIVCELLGDADGQPTLLETLRTDPMMLGTPIIVVTSWLLPAGATREIAEGCSRLLTKPCTPTMLLRELCDVLSAHKR